MSALLRTVTVAKERPNVQRIIITAAAVQHLSSTRRPCGLHLIKTDVSSSRGHMCRISVCNRPQHTPYLIVIAVIHECRKRTAPNLIANTTTQAGLKSRAELDRGIYPIGMKITDAELRALNLKLAKFHGDWNYTLLPQGKTT
jgi:hypothetical protein